MCAVQFSPRQTVGEDQCPSLRTARECEPALPQPFLFCSSLQHAVREQNPMHPNQGTLQTWGSERRLVLGVHA